MYEAFFGLSSRPFASVARTDQYFPGQAIEAARQTLARSIERAEGVGMVVGPSGTGKTLLCQLLAEQFRESFEVALLAGGRLPSRKALLQAILYEMGRPYRGMDEGELRLALVDYLTLDESSKGGMVLLVDEAHTLPLRLLEEIRMVANLVSRGEPRARVVLAGGAILEERFASPKLESFNQRITARCYLESLGRSETEQYVQGQIQAAGGAGHEVFPPQTCQAVYHATDGIPRLVNQVCDHALLLAYTDGQRVVEPSRIEEAWADLQQLPTPWNGDAREDGPSGVIEFGGLDDEDEDLDEAGGSTARQTVPMLRVTREDDADEEADEDLAEAGALDADVEPADRVERIQEALSELEDDFQPAGSIGPEVELVFGQVPSAAPAPEPAAEDPFAEEFAEEETVCEAHVPVRRSAAVQRPDVPERTPEVVRTVEPAVGSSVEIVGPPSEPWVEPAPDAAEESATWEMPETPATAEPEPQPASEPQPEPKLQPKAASEPEPEPEPEPQPEPDTCEAEPDVSDAEPETLPLHRDELPAPDEEPSSPEAGEADDLIVVEDGYEEGAIPHQPAASPVRRPEFGRLFATLREGR
jgi:type II secretory pathway predicted ATPase ExeA